MASRPVVSFRFNTMVTRFEFEKLLASHEIREVSIGEEFNHLLGIAIDFKYDVYVYGRFDNAPTILLTDIPTLKLLNKEAFKEYLLGVLADTEVDESSNLYKGNI